MHTTCSVLLAPLVGRVCRSRLHEFEWHLSPILFQDFFALAHFPGVRVTRDSRNSPSDL